MLLKHAISSNDATLNCIVPNKNKTGFIIDDQESTKIGNSTNSTISLVMTNKSRLCSIDEEEEKDNSVKKKSSSGGLSKGATAGVVVGSVVGVGVIVGTVTLLVTKSSLFTTSSGANVATVSEASLKV